LWPTRSAGRGPDEGVLSAVSHIEDFGQYLIRALIYRLVTDAVFHGNLPLPPKRASAYGPTVALADRLVKAR
jgi:hypothetical protein